MSAAIESSRVCPPADALALFVDGGLEIADRAAIERHVDGCTLCRRIAREQRSESLDTSADRLRGVLVDEPPGRLGRYEVRDRIGAGAMGTVYEARDPELERTVAIKCVAIRDAATLARHRERLAEEAQALAGIADPRVVRIYDVGDQDGLLFLVMERVEGSTLRNWVKGRTRAEILAAFAEAGRVLGALHRRGLVHGDFKPDNVIVEPGGRVRLLDFGLARSLGDLETGEERSGRGRGTPVYMAPELLEGQASTPATDQWAWAVSLFEALCGRRPFSGQDLEGLQQSASRGRLRWPDVAVRRRVRRAVSRALQPLPDRRWASMEACVRALHPRRRRGVAAVLGLASAIGLLVPSAPALPELAANAPSWPAPWDGSAQDRERPPAPLGQESIVFELRQELAAAEWMANADAIDRAYSKVAAVVNEAESIGFAALTAEALSLRGRLLRRQGQVEPAIADIERAHALAIGIGYDVVAAYSAEELTVILGVEGGRPEEAERWSRHADAAIERGGIEIARATLANSRGLVAMANNDIENARDHFERSLVLMRKAGAEPPRLSTARYNLGSIMLRLGFAERAEALIRSASAMPLTNGEVMGPTRGTMLVGLAMALEAQGKVQDAMDILESAIEVLGSGTPRRLMLAHASYNLGALHLDHGEVADAIEPLERAVALYTSTVGPDHTDTALAQGVLGDALSLLGRHDEADTLLATALVTMQASVAPHDPELIQVLRSVARNEAATGDLDRAARTLRDAVTAAADGPPHEVGLLLNSLGKLERERGNLDEAEALIRRAIAIETESTSPFYRSVRRENLAITLRDAERFDEALDVLDEALTLLPGSARPRTAELLSVRGSIGLRANRPQLAAASLEQALAMLDATKPLARIEWLRLLAKAESDLGQREAAEKTLSTCRELAANTPDGPRALHEAEQWLSRSS